ncbi:hypothetical protein B0T22DRAFT_494039 [Podospora appendiculata]|uniref:Uncharacterized protein n=1 Tax=Podospora appendiculata TaxID=314037 RepID=A0AAE0X0Q6_9PEZI|nr:hypothetical protein B0T22DRAFT_494039 [Podospora appendiculata]
MERPARTIFAEWLIHLHPYPGNTPNAALDQGRSSMGYHALILLGQSAPRRRYHMICLLPRGGPVIRGERPQSARMAAALLFLLLVSTVAVAAQAED